MQAQPAQDQRRRAVAFLPELGLVGKEQASALVGVVPCEDGSGTHQGRRAPTFRLLLLPK